MLGEIPPEREMYSKLLKTAIPSTAEAVLVAVVSLVDTVMVSKLGNYAISAVGLTTQPRLLAISIFFALSFATCALVARRRGAGDRDSANRILKSSLVLVVMLSVVVSAVCLIFADDFIRLMGSEPDTHEYGVQYFRIIMGGLFFNVMSLVMNAAQRGVGNTKIALRSNLTNNAVNIVFNYLLIGGNFGFPALGVRGAAIATVMGSMAAFLMSLLSLMPQTNFVSLRYKLSGRLFSAEDLGSIWHIGSGALAENLCLRFSFILFAGIVARLGTTMNATYVIGMNIMTVSFSFADGIGAATVSHFGYYLGQKRPDISRIYAKYAQRTGFCISVLLSICFIFFGKALYGLFSEDPVVIENGVQIMRVMCEIVMIQIALFVTNSCLRAAGDVRFTSLVAITTLIRPLAAYLLCIVWDVGLVGAFIGIGVDQLVRFVIVMARFAGNKWMALKR